MKTITRGTQCLFIVFVGALITILSAPAWALDGYQDRRGFFFGANVGGGAGIAVPSGAPGAAVMGGIQLGAGATQNLTLALDIDCGVALLDDMDRIIIVIAIGPKLAAIPGSICASQ